MAKRRPSWLEGYEYIRLVKCGLRDVHGFVARPGEPANDPCFDLIPDGEYPLQIHGREDRVRLENGRIICRQWD